MVKLSLHPDWNTRLIPNQVGTLWLIVCFLLSMREGWCSHQEPGHKLQTVLTQRLVGIDNLTYKTGNWGSVRSCWSVSIAVLTDT